MRASSKAPPVLPGTIRRQVSHHRRHTSNPTSKEQPKTPEKDVKSEPKESQEQPETVKVAEKSLNVANNQAFNTPRKSPISKSPKHEYKSYKDRVFDELLTVKANKVASMDPLRQQSWSGIPSFYRSTVWKLLLGYSQIHHDVVTKKRREYQNLVANFWTNVPDEARTQNEQVTLRQVLVDIPRTHASKLYSNNHRFQKMMARILYLHAVKNPSTGYVQGFNELICPFLHVFLGGYFQGKRVISCNCDCGVGNMDGGHRMDEECVCIELVTDEQLQEVEADTFCALTILLSKISTHYTDGQPGLWGSIKKLSKIMKRVDIDLHNHLMDNYLQYEQICFKWFHTFLLREVSLEGIIRMWDTYLSCHPRSGFESFHIYVIASVLCQMSEELRGMNSIESMLEKLQDLEYKGDMDILLSQAFVLSTLFEDSNAHLAD